MKLNEMYSFNFDLLQKQMEKTFHTPATLSLHSGVPLRIVRVLLTQANVNPSLNDAAALAESVKIPLSALVIKGSVVGLAGVKSDDLGLGDDLPRFARQRLRRAERKRLGVCIDCGGGPLTTQQRCYGCAEKNNAAARKRREKRLGITPAN